MPSIFFILLIAFALYQCSSDSVSKKDITELGRALTESVKEQVKKSKEEITQILTEQRKESKKEIKRKERKYREIP